MLKDQFARSHRATLISRDFVMRERESIPEIALFPYRAPLIVTSSWYLMEVMLLDLLTTGDLRCAFWWE
ncbi:hypothetical protein [Nitratireductor sp. OM-1]|uniref:hypothetical protein n=1 Tax=Nitratireductor sp. OM-1 TaxID=1756988 RepID=UPI0013AFACFB|nr:hypothetical protein [Nitratireductor sp. OM-1]